MPEIERISEIIAGINPDKYAEAKDPNKKSLKAKFKDDLKKDFFGTIKNIEGYNLAASSSEQYKLIYDSSSETLEPVYFWVLDKINELVGKPEKLVDNFVSSPGSGHFSELMGKATKMQEEAMKIMQTSGVLIKSMINIIYDLKEFEIRLSQYKSAESKNQTERESGLLALKQIWMDNVDIKRGAGSINALSTGNLNFVTLRDSFMIANSLEDVKNLDLNERVKRILEARVSEFLKWRELSERELKKRYDIEKIYLKNQLSSLKLYARWAKPYLKAAAELEQNDRIGNKDASLVHAFNTIVFELALFSKKSFDVYDAAVNKQIPEAFKDLNMKRKYSACVLVDFYFRGIPQRIGQNYVFGGRAEVVFRAYVLNDQELEVLKNKLEQSDMKDVLKLVQGMTDESLQSLQEDIDYFLKEADKREEKSEDVNPFLALLGFGKKEKKSEDVKKLDLADIKPDSYVEKVIRNLVEADARERCFKLFDIYKKSHGMASHPHEEFEANPFNTWQKGRTWFSSYKS